VAERAHREEGSLIAFQQVGRNGRGGEENQVAFSGRAELEHGRRRYRGWIEEGGRQVLALFLCLHFVRPPELTWVALRPTRLPAGSS